jgi:aminoglycoside 6'-N-acetyltransferase I
MPVEIRLLGPGDAKVLERVAEDVFDGPVRPELAREFVGDDRHHLVVALDDGVIVGMVSAVHYIHPDKPAQLFINEVGVAPSHHRQGLGRRLLEAMLTHGRTLGCTDAWVGTEESNVPARRLYASAGGIEEPFLLYFFKLQDRGAPP